MAHPVETSKCSKCALKFSSQLRAWRNSFTTSPCLRPYPVPLTLEWWEGSRRPRVDDWSAVVATVILLATVARVVVITTTPVPAGREGEIISSWGRGVRYRIRLRRIRIQSASKFEDTNFIRLRGLSSWNKRLIKDTSLYITAAYEQCEIDYKSFLLATGGRHIGVSGARVGVSIWVVAVDGVVPVRISRGVTRAVSLILSQDNCQTQRQQ